MPVKEKKEAPARGKQSGGKRRGRMPSKRSINLANINVKSINWAVAIPSIILILAAAAVFGKFGVADRLSAASRAQNEVRQLQQRLDEDYEILSAYDETNEIYAHYTWSGMTKEELGRADRVRMMDMIQRVVRDQLMSSSWSVSGNQLTLVIDGQTLQEINSIVSQLNAEPLVDYCSMSNAATRTEKNGDFSIEYVTGNLIVYLKDATLVEEAGEEPEEESGSLIDSAVGALVNAVADAAGLDPNGPSTEEEEGQ